MVDITPADGIPPAEIAEVELYHPHSWWTKYVFSQDAKVIAIQYSATGSAIGLVALEGVEAAALEHFLERSTSSPRRPTTSSSPCTA